MLPQKMLKNKWSRLAKIAFPRTFLDLKFSVSLYFFIRSLIRFDMEKRRHESVLRCQ